MMIDLEAECYSSGIFGTEVNTLAFERFRACSRGYDIVNLAFWSPARLSDDPEIGTPTVGFIVKISFLPRTIPSSLISVAESIATFEDRDPSNSS